MHYSAINNFNNVVLDMLLKYMKYMFSPKNNYRHLNTTMIGFRSQSFHTKSNITTLYNDGSVEQKLLINPVNVTSFPNYIKPEFITNTYQC